MNFITESNMKFIDDERLFHIENSVAYRTIPHTKTVEFVMLRDSCLYYIEAKSSSPNPKNSDSSQKFQEFIKEISEKFSHSFDLLLALLTQRMRDDIQEVPHLFRTIDIATVSITFVLIIRDHEKQWLLPVSEKLKSVLKQKRTTWNVNIAVMNYDIAVAKGIVHP